MFFKTYMGCTSSSFETGTLNAIFNTRSDGVDYWYGDLRCSQFFDDICNWDDNTWDCRITPSYDTIANTYNIATY